MLRLSASFAKWKPPDNLKTGLKTDNGKLKTDNGKRKTENVKTT